MPLGCVRLFIDAYGAQGGDGGGRKGGLGARVEGSVDACAAGAELCVLVGQRGESRSFTGIGGGGGGSFVWAQGREPLVAAGGCGPAGGGCLKAGGAKAEECALMDGVAGSEGTAGRGPVVGCCKGSQPILIPVVGWYVC